MLSRAALQRGFTLIEIAITLAVVGIVIALGAPSFSNWIQNTQIRNAGESVLTGIKLARAEALKRNSPVLFQLMTSTDASCGLSVAGPSWVVSRTSAVGLCNATDETVTPPNLIRKMSATDGATNVVYAATQSSIGFDALGRVTPVPAGDVVIFVTNPTGGDCFPSGEMRCQTLVVTAAGQARMCDPAVSTVGDPRNCGG